MAVSVASEPPEVKYTRRRFGNLAERVEEREASFAAGSDWNWEVWAKAICEDCAAMAWPISATPWPMLMTAACPAASRYFLLSEAVIQQPLAWMAVG